MQTNLRHFTGPCSSHPTTDVGVASSILARYHTFVEIDQEIISMVILPLSLIQERLLSITS